MSRPITQLLHLQSKAKNYYCTSRKNCKPQNAILHVHVYMYIIFLHLNVDNTKFYVRYIHHVPAHMQIPVTQMNQGRG